MPTSPEWWTWDLSFTAHAETRMEQRGVIEVDLRAIEAKLLVVVTAYEVPE